MKTSELRPVQINDLTHINNVLALDKTDTKCIEEIRNILEKYDCISKFGITLLHKHFDLEQDEVLVESCNVAERTLTAKPQKIDQVERKNLVETVWRFDGTNGRDCSRYCPTDKDGNHNGYSDH